MNSRTAGLAAAGIFFLVGGGQAYLALDLSRGTLAEPGPGLFPFIVGILMCVAALTCLRPMIRERNPIAFDFAKALEPSLLVAALVAFIVLLPRVGFVLPAMLLQVVTLQVFGMRGAWRRLLLAAVTTAVAVVVFEILLDVRFPAPSWIS